MNEVSSLTIYNWLQHAQQQLKRAGVDTARLDALVLLTDVSGQDKSWVLAHPDFALSEPQIALLNKYIIQRSAHVPIAYIRGKSEFYGRNFAVNTNVLVPRSESESLITLLVQYAQNHTVSHIIDIGTGSGALAITAKLELPDIDVTATDISKACLDVAQHNARALDAAIRFMQGDLLAAIPRLQPQTALLCNLPYVPDGYPINAAATHEPKLALFSGPDGLDHYRTLFTQVNVLPTKPACIITESLIDQHEALGKLAAEAGYRLTKQDGLAQLFTS